MRAASAGAESLPDFSSYSLDALLTLAQTDQTRDHELGYAFAKAAFERTFDDATAHEARPVGRGKAAALAGLRGAQAGHSKLQVEMWFSRSVGALPFSHDETQRELIATYSNEGRALGILALRATIPEARTELTAAAEVAFGKGEQMLHERRKPGEPEDRYGIPLARHHATFLAIQEGRRHRALEVARVGIQRARQADNEGKPAAEHLAYVTKQTLLFAASMRLARLGILDVIPGVHDVRRKVALRLMA